MTVIAFTAYGRPAPQGSKRAVGRTKTGHVILMEDSERVKPWRQAVQDAGRERMAALGLTVPIAEPVALTAILTVALRPKRSKYDRPAGPPDLDKLLRAIGDALTIGGVIRDDALIVEIDAAGKYWPGQHPRAPKTPGAFIMVRTLRSPFG